MPKLIMPRIAAALLAAGACAAATAQVVPGPQRYFQCQIAARQATNVGLEERANLLARAASAAEISAAGERSRLRVEAAFMGCGYSSEQLAAYAYQRADALSLWLAQQPATQSRLNALQARLAQLSTRISAFRQAQVAR